MKIVLAYSGGIGSAMALAWLKEKHQAEVIAFCADLGLGESGLEKRAIKAGAAKVCVEDLQEEFARDFVFPLIQAGAIRDHQFFVGTSITRPLIAKRLVEIARQEKAGGIAHGAAAKGNEPVRFELTAASLAPELQVIAPWRDGSYRAQFPNRAEMIRYCDQHKIPVAVAAKQPYSTDRNLLQTSFEAGVLEDPWFDASDAGSKGMYQLTVSPEEAPDKAESITLDFEKGRCTGINHKPLTPLGVMKTLNRLGGKHGIGRVDLVENRGAGSKSRGVYESPAGAILTCGLGQIESLALDRETQRLRDSLVPKYTEFLEYGAWFSPERQALQSILAETQKNVTGSVKLNLFKGNVIVAGRKSPQSLYHTQLAATEADPTQAYNQDDETGFIRMNSLRLKVASHLANAIKP